MDGFELKKNKIDSDLPKGLSKQNQIGFEQSGRGNYN